MPFPTFFYQEDEMRRSMGVPSVGGTLRDENDDNGGDVIPIKSMAMDIDTDEDEGNLNMQRFYFNPQNIV